MEFLLIRNEVLHRGGLLFSYPTIPVIIRFDYSVINYDLAFDNPFISETYKIICL